MQSTSWASGVYRIGDDVQVTVTFSENVTVTGSPQLELAIGSNNRTAGYKSTDGSAVVFSYTVAEGDSDSDGIVVNANKLTLNGGSIKDAANNDASLSHTALAAQDGHKVDGVRPKLKLTAANRLKFMSSSGGNDGAYTTDEELIIRVAFTEGGVRGSVTGPPGVTLNFDGGTRVAKWDPSLIFNPTGYPNVRFFSYVVQEGDLDSDGPTISANAINLAGGFIRDAAGNDATLTHAAVSADTRFIVDAVAPTVSSIAITSDPGDDDTYGTGDKIEVTVTFSENMSLPISISCSPEVVHCEAELELDIGGTARTADYQSHDGAEVVYAYTVQAGDADDNGISIGANKLTGQQIKDAAGRFGFGINDADLRHDAVAEDAGHKVATSSQPAKSTDATLSALTLSGVDFGTFASGTISYSAQVANSVTETTVTPTVNNSNASYVIKLGGVEDADGKISLAVGSNVITVEVTAEDGNTTRTYTVTITRAGPPSTDATLSALTMSGVDFGTFAPGTTSYTAQVANTVAQTTVTPTVNHSGASYAIKLGGVTDADSVIALSVGSNVITVEVTAEDDSATRTYTVTVTRAAPASTDATLGALTLSGVDFGTFDSITVSYTTTVANDVSQTTVTPTVNHSGASYVIKLNGTIASDGVIPLSVGSNTITIEVTAEDGQTKRTYSITITRPASSDATLERLDLSGIDIGDGIGRRGTYVGNQTSFNASVYHSISQTTVTPTVNHPGASYVVKLGGVEDAGRSISLAVGSNVITIEVTAEDDSTTQTYTATVNRATASAPTTGELSTDAPPVNFRAIYVSKTFAGFALSYPRNRGLFGWVGQRYEHDGDSFVSSGADSRYEFSDSEDLGGLRLEFGDENVEPGALYKWVAMLTNSQGSTVIETSVTVRIPPDGTTELSSDATLSALTLTGMELQKTGGLHGEVIGFESYVHSYAASVGNSVSQTTVVPTVNHSGASYVIKLDGVEDADGVVSLAVGSNVITVEVTAGDDSATRTYTVAVTRAAALSTDATLGALTLSGVDFGTFDSITVSYTTTVANDVSQTTVTPTVNHSGASYVIKLNGTIASDGVIPLSVGSNTITIEVTAEDGNGSLVYTLEVTRSEPATPGTSGQRVEDRYDTNNNVRIDKNEVLEAINDYLFGEGDEAISKGDVIRLINLYLFG